MALSTLATSSTLFHGCDARKGGALYMADTTAALFQVVFESNRASFGGGVYLSDMQVKVNLDSVSFVNNSASISGGAAFFYRSPRAVPSAMPVSCDVSNRALSWGPCMGSTFGRLSVQVREKDLFAGIELSLMVKTLDAFDQVIRTGQETLQMIVVKDEGLENNDRVAMSGATIKRLEGGEVSYDLAFKPSFTLMDSQAQRTRVDSLRLVYAEGADQETGESIQSRLIPIALQGDENVCPLGYVLSLQSPPPAIGGCEFCKSGSYTLNPFAGGPGCIPCPAGAVCVEGGANVSFPVGTWGLEEGRYRLQGCPPGHYPIRDDGNPVKD
eukprot:749847-Hanusia_phi.AAC.3